MKLIEKLAREDARLKDEGLGYIEGFEAGFRKATEMINQALIDRDEFDWDSKFILGVGEEEVG